MTNMVECGPACFINHLAALSSDLKAVLLLHSWEIKIVGVGAGHEVHERQGYTLGRGN